MEDAWDEIKRTIPVSSSLKYRLGPVAKEAVAKACSYDRDSDFREGWEYLSPDSRSRRSSEEWLIKAKEERKQIPKATFEPASVGEVFLGEDGSLAVVEVFGVNTEYHNDGKVVAEKGTILAGLVCIDGRWYLQSINWYPQK